MRRIGAFGEASLKLALQILMVMSLILGMALPTAQAEEARTVRVGYFYLTGYHEIDAQGRMQGYGYDLLQKMRLYNDWHYEYIGHEQKWNEGFKMLERGEVDLITGVRKFPDRLEKFANSNNPIGRSASVLVVLPILSLMLMLRKRALPIPFATMSICQRQRLLLRWKRLRLS